MSRKPKNDAGTLVVAFVIAVALISTAVDFLKQHIEIIVLRISITNYMRIDHVEQLQHI